MRGLLLIGLMLLSQDLLAGTGDKVYIGAQLNTGTHMVAWPLISLPDGKVPKADSLYCKSGDESVPDSALACTVPIKEVLTALNMGRKTREWFDAKGVRHAAQAGYHDGNPLGGQSDMLDGIVIGTEKALEPNREMDLKYLGAITSAPGLIAGKTVRKLAAADKPELARMLAQWRKRYFRECAEWCTKGVGTLAQVKNVKVTVTEYKLPSGRVFQHFFGRSTRDTTRAATEKFVGDRLYVIVDFWKYADTKTFVDESMTESTGCYTQCSGLWRGSPDVIEFRNKLYILGEYSGGTTYGYFLFGIKGDRLVVLSSVSGGS